jgi:hypothetical protein
MSWSISVVGKAPAVREKAQSDLKKITCQEPEETIKNLVGSIVDMALCSFPDSVAVQIAASGSQGPAYEIDQAGNYKQIEGKLTNSLKVDISPLYGFVE